MIRKTTTHKHRKIHVQELQCTIKLVPGPVKLTAVAEDARAGVNLRHRCARLTGGGVQTRLLAARRLVRGRYTLAITTRHRRRRVMICEQITLPGSAGSVLSRKVWR